MDGKPAWRRTGIRADMSRVQLILIAFVCIVAPVQVKADDLPAAPPKVAPPRNRAPSVW
jgi:hypothetical protein